MYNYSDQYKNVYRYRDAGNILTQGTKQECENARVWHGYSGFFIEKVYEPSEELVQALNWIDGHKEDCPLMYPRKNNNGATKEQEQDLQQEINEYILSLNFDDSIYYLDNEQMEQVDSEVVEIFVNVLTFLK